MSAFKLLENPNFKESLDMMHLGYIKKCYADAGKEAPVPKSLIPLEFEDKAIQKGLNQLRQGAKNALFAYDQHMKKMEGK